jgi:hypothetical protein
MKRLECIIEIMLTIITRTTTITRIATTITATTTTAPDI